MSDPWNVQLEALGAFIRSQRKLARLSLRQLAELTSLSNPYLSQIERGLHQPSVRVLKSIADALDVSAETLLTQAGLLDPDRVAAAARPRRDVDAEPWQEAGDEAVVAAVRADRRLTAEQKAALIAVYTSMAVSDGRADA